MQFIFDNLIATIVAMTLALTLISQQATVQQDNLERMSIYQAKGQSLSFAEWVEDDVVKLGARFGSERNRFTYINQESADGHIYTSDFQYYYNKRVDSDQALRVEVRYEIEPTGALPTAIDRTTGDTLTVPLYTLTRSTREGDYRNEGPPSSRWVGGEPDWVETPGFKSPGGLRHFRIQPLDSEGNSIEPPSTGMAIREADAERSDYVRIAFEVMPTLFPLYRARLISDRPLHWNTTVEIRPF